MNGVISIKIDVFSFGVLLLEIVCGKKNNSRYKSHDLLNLIGYVSFSLNNLYMEFLNFIVNVVYTIACIRRGNYGMKVRV